MCNVRWPDYMSILLQIVFFPNIFSYNKYGISKVIIKIVERIIMGENLSFDIQWKEFPKFENKTRNKIIEKLINEKL